jgi:hypothetical protein
MMVPRQFALAIVDAQSGLLRGYVGSRPGIWSALGPEQARKFASAAEAHCWLDGTTDPLLGFVQRIIVVGLVGRGGGRW